jgi:hypothetical protein
MLVAAGSAAGATLPGPIPRDGQASAEIRLASPTHYAIVLHQVEKIRTLHATGDAIFHPQDPARSLRVEHVEPGSLRVRPSRWKRSQTLLAGSAIPGYPALTFIRTVLLEAVEYRYKVVDRIVHKDPILVALEGSKAVLEVEAPRPTMAVESLTPRTPVPPDRPARATLDAGTLEQVRVREVGPDLYEVPTADVRPVLENVGRVLVGFAPSVLPTLSRKDGLQYQITSAASDGILTPRGFVVTSPKMAARAGIEQGDRILSVNGIPVDSLGSLYGIYRHVQRDPDLSAVRVDLERRGSHLTKTYRIR